MGIRRYRGQILCDKRWPDGKRFKRQYPNKKQAQSMLDDIEHSIKHGYWRDFRDELLLRNRDALTLSEFSETYIEEYAKVRNKTKSWKRKETAFNAMNPSLGGLDLDSITPARVHKYVGKRKLDGVSEGTINRELTILKHTLTYATECGVIKVNPIEKFRLLREEKKERRRFTDEEINSVIDAVKPVCRPIFVFILETGCRREEALSLTHTQIQEESGLVVFDQDTKSRKYRYVPLTEEALQAVKTLPRHEECRYVFYNPKTKNRWFDCRKPWEEARLKVNLKELQVKDLRRHFAIKLAENGADMHDIQQVLGHASVATTEKHYAQFSPTHSAKKILRVLEGGKAAELKRNSASEDDKAEFERSAVNA